MVLLLEFGSVFIIVVSGAAVRETGKFAQCARRHAKKAKGCLEGAKERWGAREEAQGHATNRQKARWRAKYRQTQRKSLEERGWADQTGIPETVAELGKSRQNVYCACIDNVYSSAL